MKPELIFIIDPMCSWCWGFHPVIKELREKHSDKYRYSLVVGGLRTKGQMAWTQENRESFDYDTYPACRAIVTVRELWGDEASFEYLEKIQEAFYARGEDTTALETLANYVEKKKEFLAFYHTERAEILMQHDFSKARSMGANAFPSVVKIDTDGHMCCQQGYQSLEGVLQ